MPQTPAFVERFLATLGWATADLTAAGGVVGGADYCVRLDGSPVFFIGTSGASTEAAYKLRRYGWSAKTSVSVLLTPDALTVLDCRARPSPRDEVAESLVFRCDAREYERRADEIRSILSRDAMSQARGLEPSTRRAQDVDQAFLEEIERHRERLGKDAERVIDHIVVSRFREDRGIDDYRRLVDSGAPAEQQDIARTFYYPDCPFEFSVMSTEVLGSMHERLLATEKGHARKTGGVYYTPHHVVRYVVESTLNPLLEGRTPEEVSKIRVLDPACGAGSFLLGAYHHIIAWHIRCGWESPAAKRQQIARDNIFGVDLDPRAAELTRLALGLEIAAGTRCATLPDLGQNIRCGNSLLPKDFDYAKSFPHVFAEGGFDAVIGNPPYLSYGGRQSVELSGAERDHFAQHYECAGWPTSHSFFMERAVKDLSRRVVSFIVPDQVGHLEGYRSLRALVAREGALAEVKYWGEGVFKEAVTPSLTFLVDKQGAEAQRASSIRVEARSKAQSTEVIPGPSLRREGSSRSCARSRCR